MDFFSEYTKEVSKNIPNDYSDNWDEYRYGKKPEDSLRVNLRNVVIKALNSKDFYNYKYFINAARNIEPFYYLYNQLENAEDKQLLVKVLSYYRLGHKKVKLPLNTGDYWRKLGELEQSGNKNDFITTPNGHILNRYNLKDSTEYPIELYFNHLGIMADFVLKQYEYKKDSVLIKPEKGDVIIDCGACWGDTALLFACETGSTGKVYSFEFVPENLNIINKNLGLNPTLKDRVEIVQHPVWKDSISKVFFRDAGAGTRVSLERKSNNDTECTTLSIDDLVKQKNIQKVDFIKMDIEGAEVNALQGAADTIRRFKPKLAIALYHSEEDFRAIPKLIKELVPEYKLYYSHFTIHYEESILYAIPG